MQGPWEIAISSSAHSGYGSLLEVNLQSNATTFSSYELVNIPTQSVSVGTTPPYALSYEGTYYNLDYLCGYSGPGNGGPLAGTISGMISGTIKGNAVSFTYQWSTALGLQILAQGQGTYNGTQVQGTYQSHMQGTSPSCSDSGTFSAYPAASVTSPYTGVLTFPDSSVDNVSMSLSGSCDTSVDQGYMCPVTANGTLSGPDNGTFSLTGRSIGNYVQLGGSDQTVLGMPASYYSLRLPSLSGQPMLLEDVWKQQGTIFDLSGVLTN
jgi:hypothetical protein